MAFDDLKAISVNGEVTYQTMALDAENDPIQIFVANGERKSGVEILKLLRNWNSKYDN